jgi:hypothetical protein
MVSGPSDETPDFANEHDPVVAARLPAQQERNQQIDDHAAVHCASSFPESGFLPVRDPKMPRVCAKSGSRKSQSPEKRGNIDAKKL